MLRQRPAARLARSLALGLSFAALLASTAGCEKQPLRVGVLLPLTGADAAYGESMRRGLELGREQLVAKGAEPNFVFAFEDSESDPGVALARYEELLASGALLTVGGLTPQEARVLAPAAAERERVVLSPTADDQHLSDAGQYFYRLAPSAAVTGSTIASFASQDLSLETMSLVAQTAAQGDSLEEGLGSTFDRHGGEVVGRFDLDDVELSWALSEIDRLHPDAVALAGWGGWLAETVQALREAGYRGKIFTPESFAAPSVRDAAGRAARGVLIAGSPFDPQSEGDAASAFTHAYRARFQTEPDLYAAAGWDTVLVLAAALEDHPNLPGEVRQWLRDDVKDVAGVIGHLQFDATGAATKFPRIYSVAADLTLRDHSRWLEQERRRIAEERRILEEKKKAILDQLEHRTTTGGSQAASSG